MFQSVNPHGNPLRPPWRARQGLGGLVTHNPWQRMAIVLLALAWWAAPVAAGATAYFVRTSGADVNDGLTAATAFRTIQRAADIMVAGDTAYVGAGNYTEAIDTRRAGTAASPIRFLADTSGANTGDAGTVRVSSPSSIDVFDVNHSYQTLQGFLIRNGADGVEVTRAQGIVLEDIEVQNARDDAFDFDRSSVTMRRCSAKNPRSSAYEATGTGAVVIEDSTASNARGAGVYVNGTGVAIRRTTIASSRSDGIRVDAGTLQIFDSAVNGSFDNGIDQRSGSLTMSGTSVDGSRARGVEFSGTAIQVINSSVTNSRESGVGIFTASTASFERVEISDSSDFGLYLGNLNTATITNGIYARNGRSGIYATGSARNVDIWHVTVVRNGWPGIYHGGRTMTVRNSIAASNGNRGLYSDASGSGLTHSYNLFFGNSGGDLFGTSPGTGEIFLDPQFAGASDFHLQTGSPALDAGTDASAITAVDFEAMARPSGRGFDMGAFESLSASSVDHFTLEHDQNGIYCLAETIKVTARDAGGDPVDDYTGAITLDTQSSRGTWLAISPSLGSFSDPTADDGLATYTFADADDGVATFTLSYGQGNTPLDVDVFESADVALRDDDSEGSLSWGPSGLLVTGAPLSNPPPLVINSPIDTQTAGTTFPVYLTAFGQTPTDPTCGVIETYTGAKALKFWSDYADPTTGSRTPTVDGTSIGQSQGTASSQNVVFASGQATLGVKYKDVGRIALSALDDTVVEPITGITGGSSPFVVRPSTLVVTSVERPDGSSNPGVSSPAGTVFVAAGTPFRVEVEVRDAEGDRTPNYGRETAPEGIRLESSQLVAPAGGRNGSSGTGVLLQPTLFTVTSDPGRFLGTQFGFDEVGAIKLRASIADGAYLDTPGLSGPESGVVGRFVPDHFETALNTPEFSTSCLAGAFTYLGEPFDYAAGSEPEVTVTAQNLQNGTTENYEGSWFRLQASDLSSLSYTAAAGTLTPTAPDAPTVSPTSKGVGRIVFDQGPSLSFLRAAPASPFDAELALTFDLQDADGVAAATNPVRFGTAAAGLGIAWTGGKEQRFGRLAFTPAHGSELETLPVPFRAEHWNGATFVPNGSDQCTSLSTAGLSVIPVPGTLSTTPSLAYSPLLSGDAGLTLSAPGSGSTGYADLLFDLAGASRPWLLGDWDGDGLYLENPQGRATFGINAGEGEMIFVRDVF